MGLHFSLSFDIDTGTKIINYEVYEIHITHNLAAIARQSNTYNILWKPYENAYIYAKDIIPQLKRGLKYIIDNESQLQKLNPENGWGSYDLYIDKIKSIIKACNEYPNALIEADI